KAANTIDLPSDFAYAQPEHTKQNIQKAYKPKHTSVECSVAAGDCEARDTRLQGLLPALRGRRDAGPPALQATEPVYRLGLQETRRRPGPGAPRQASPL